MARSIRIEYEGAIYHVMARANRRERLRAGKIRCDWAKEFDTFVKTKENESK